MNERQRDALEAVVGLTIVGTAIAGLFWTVWSLF
jgi:hypothetical protein